MLVTYMAFSHIRDDYSLFKFLIILVNVVTIVIMCQQSQLLAVSSVYEYDNLNQWSINSENSYLHRFFFYSECITYQANKRTDFTVDLIWWAR